MNCYFEEHEQGMKCKCCGYYIKAKGKINKTCKKPCNEYPSIIEMAGNFVSAMVEAAKDGFAQASEEEVQKRKAICEACPLYDLEQKRCTVCGCGQGKLALASSECPKGFWSKVE